MARPKAVTDEGATPTHAGQTATGGKSPRRGGRLCPPPFLRKPAIPRRGGAYPKGTGSTYRSCFAVCRWRCSARTPPGNAHQFVGADDSVRPRSSQNPPSLRRGHLPQGHWLHRPLMLRGVSLALLRPPACTPAAPFESNLHRQKKRDTTRCLFSFGGDCWTRTSDLLRVKQAL